MVSIKLNNKFLDLSQFSSASNQTYCLLPFKFHRISKERELLVNEIGDFLIYPTGTVEKIITKKISQHSNPSLYADLISNFFISEEPIPPLIGVKSSRYRTKKAFLEYFTGLHIFVMTLRCNHTCHYCQVSRVSEDRYAYDLNRKNLDAAIDIMLQIPNPNLTMEFQGGEPLLVFENIKYAVKRAEILKEKNRKVTYVVCTNLSVVTEEILEFCKDYNILISTSLDGPEYIHNANRHRSINDSYDLTIKGIELCRKKLGEDRVSALMTTSSLSLEYPIEIIDEYINRGFNEIFLRPISPYGFAIKNEKKNIYETEKFLEFYKKALNYIITLNLSGKYFVENYTRIILEKILTPFNMVYVDLLSPAGLINNVVVYNYDGKVYASDESRMLAEMGDYTFQIGDLNIHGFNDIFYGDKSKEIAEVWATESLAGCSECAFQSYCGADPVRSHATQGDMYGFRPTSSHCRKNMEIINHIFNLIDQRSDVEKVFQSWVYPPKEIS